MRTANSTQQHEMGRVMFIDDPDVINELETSTHTIKEVMSNDINIMVDQDKYCNIIDFPETAPESRMCTSFNSKGRTQN